MSTRPYFSDLVLAELARARAAYGPISTIHEAFGLIYEQLDQFTDLLKLKRRDAHRLLHELVQIAAMCQRSAEDLCLLPAPEEGT